MARFPFVGTYQDGLGNAIESGTVYVYLADTTTAASIYTAKTGGSAVNTVTTSSSGGFIFYVDESDYPAAQLFDIKCSKTNYQDAYIYDQPILPAAASQSRIDSVSGKTLNDLFDGGYDVPIKPSSITVQSSNVLQTMKQFDGTSVIELKYTDATGMAVLNTVQAGSKFELQHSGTRVFHFDYNGNIARLKGGSNNTNGHLIPNVADDTFALLSAAQAFSAKTITLAAGTTTVAPFKFTSGTNLTTAEAGAIEYDGTYFYATRTGTTRETILTSSMPATVWPSFAVNRNAVNQSITNASWTKVQWTTEEFDTNNNFDSSTNYRFTPTVSGKYLLTSTCYISGLAAGKLFQMALYKNGSEFKVGARQYQQTTGDMACEASWVVDANGTTDYFEIYVYHDDTAARDLVGNSANSYFMGSRIG